MEAAAFHLEFPFLHSLMNFCCAQFHGQALVTCSKDLKDSKILKTCMRGGLTGDLQEDSGFVLQ